MLVSIVIPVYNTSVADEIVARIASVFAGRPETYEVIFVDDSSPRPQVWAGLVALATRHPAVRAIQLTRNFGQHAASLCGLEEARGDVIITMDDDLEHSPEDIPALLAQAQHDVVFAQFKNKRHSLLTRASSRIKGVFDWVILGKPRGLQLTSFRLLSRVVVDGMLSVRTPHPFLPALIFHVTKDVSGVEIEHQSRPVGRSNYTFRKRLRLFNDLLIHNSSLVLRLVGNTGVLVAAGSFFVAGYAVYRKLMHGVAIGGWTSLFVAQALIGGLMLFGLGVIGEYLIRIIESTEGRPTYLVRRRAGTMPAE